MRLKTLTAVYWRLNPKRAVNNAQTSFRAFDRKFTFERNYVVLSDQEAAVMPVFHDSLIQGSQAWLDFRKDKISASNIAVICGISPYQSQYMLWSQMLNLTEPEAENAAMRRGKDLESTALDAYCKLTGKTMRPAVVTHSEHPWAMCSLDGISDDDSSICEIKIMGSKNHAEAMTGVVKPIYNYQANWQMYVTGLYENDYFAWSEDSNIIIKIPRNDDLISEMVKKAKEFLHCLRTITPPAYTELDYDDKSDDPHWDSLMSHYALFDEMEKKGKAGKEHIKMMLIEASNGRNCKGSNSKFTKVTTIGRIDYTKIPEIQGLDLESYRGKSVESYRITINNT